mmetsp:Transcript_66999/g.143294  ORF Transcript_66999/g.143294 Transcript_66999/m.143294 type:complete len:262 (-) Transcript_66999:99-884(-)
MVEDAAAVAASAPAVDTRCPSSRGRASDRRPRSRQQRVSRVYDQAVFCSHAKQNGVLRSHMEMWRVPRTSGKQQVLHNSSAILDTEVRDRVARDFNRWLQDRPGSLAELRTRLEQPPRPGSSSGAREGSGKGGSGIGVGPDGSLQLEPHRRCLSASRVSASQPPQGEERPWLPPWVTPATWDAATGQAAPAWSASPWASMAQGPLLWAGAVLPPRQAAGLSGTLVGKETSRFRWEDPRAQIPTPPGSRPGSRPGTPSYAAG